MGRAIHLYQGAALALRPLPHPCPFCTANLAPTAAFCTPCGMCLPRLIRDALRVTWDEGRGSESDRYAQALDAAKDHLRRKAGRS